MKLEFDTPMTRAELKASLSLALIYMLRMLGMFLILPVFAVLARNLPDASPFLVGLAISAYGLTQAIFQIPFGLWSDRWGRKPVIAFGLLLFVGGSIIAALSDSILGIILGRSLQGAGAVAAVVMALAADLTREEHRTKAMALIGISIGISFSVSMILGPVLSNWFGLKGIFWIITALAALSLVVLIWVVPNPKRMSFHREAQLNRSTIGRVMRHPELLRLDFGIFSLHLILTALFVALPQILRDQLNLETRDHWHLYLPVFLIAMVAMVPFVILAEKKRKMKAVFLAFIGLIGMAELGFAWFDESYWAIFALLCLFFTGFNLLEATLPSMVSKVAPPDLKGTAMGIYSTAQFLGAFIGGTSAGWLYGHQGPQAVFWFAAGMAFTWWLVAFNMKPPRHVSTLMVGLRPIEDQERITLQRALLACPGMAEAWVAREEQVAYLKVDKTLLKQEILEDILDPYLKLEPDSIG